MTYYEGTMTDQDVYSYYDDDENVAVEGPAVAPTRRAKLSSHLPVRFSPTVLASARAFAAEDGLSISAWVRWLVEKEVMRRTPVKTTSSESGWVFDPPQAPDTRTGSGELIGA